MRAVVTACPGRRWPARSRIAAALLATGMCALAGMAPATGAASADPAHCPLQSTASVPPGDAWAFHDTALPASPHAGVASSYIHGRGSWAGGRGSGTICQQHGAASGPAHNIVLSAEGSASVSPRVMRLGHLGVTVSLHAKVAASDDPACVPATAVAVTIFASYYEGHYDSLQLHFSGSCSAYDATFSGPALYALIAADGRQVN